MSKKSRRPARAARKSAQTQVAANRPSTFDGFRDRVLEILADFPNPANLGHMLFTWSLARGIAAADPFEFVARQGMDDFATFLPRHLIETRARAAAFASNGWIRGVDTEDEARLLKRTGLNEPNIQRNPAIIVELSDGDRTEEWSAPLLNGRVVVWRKQGTGTGEFTTADDESAIKVVRDAFRSLRRQL